MNDQKISKGRVVQGVPWQITAVDVGKNDSPKKSKI